MTSLQGGLEIPGIVLHPGCTINSLRQEKILSDLLHAHESCKSTQFAFGNGESIKPGRSSVVAADAPEPS